MAQINNVLPGTPQQQKTPPRPTAKPEDSQNDDESSEPETKEDDNLLAGDDAQLLDKINKHASETPADD